MSTNEQYNNEQIGALEALLFVHGEALSFKKIGALLEIEPDAVKALVGVYEKKLQEVARGFSLVRDGEKVQLVTKPQFAAFLEGFLKEELSETLTPASLETLSLIAYLGPIAKSKIEYLRGVNSAFTLRSLSLRGLIERTPDPQRAQHFLYRVSFDTLKHLGFTRAEELPEYQKFQSLGVEPQMPEA